MSAFPKFVAHLRFAVIAAIAASLSIACGGSATSSGDHNVGAGASGGEGAIGGSGSTGAQPAIGGTGGTAVAGGKVVQLTPGSWQMTGVVTESQASPGILPCTTVTFTLDVAPDSAGYLATIGQNGFIDSAAAEISTGSYVLGGLDLPCQLSVSGLTLQGKDSNGDGRADRLSGTASAMVSQGGGDIALAESVEIALTGVPDVTAPTLKVPTEAFDPLVGFTIAASEPLASSASLTLAGTSTVPLSATPAYSSSSNAQIDDVINWHTSQILPLAGQWTVQGRGEDPSGHALDLSGVLQTLADPGVFSQDGFEGPLVATIESGTPSIVTGLGSVTAISDAHSLWIAPGDSVLFHLRRAAAEKTLHFSARAFGQNGAPVNEDIRAGVVGGPPGYAPSISPPGDAIDTGNPNWQLASAVQEFSLPLVSAGSDVLFRVSPIPCYGNCGPSYSALMIDDLTLE